jgi:hypothetical protein
MNEEVQSGNESRSGKREDKVEVKGRRRFEALPHYLLRGV